jgi:hypothetical protein
MGRPNTCNTCCPDDPDDPGDPKKATECETLICIALVDSNTALNPNASLYDWYSEMAKWIEAYPDRLLFVMDVAGGGMYYPSNFLEYERAFSLHNYIGSKVIRDNGDEGNSTDVWNEIMSMMSMSPLDIQVLFSSAKEVSIYVKDGGTMLAEHVAGAVKLLKDSIDVAGLRVVDSITPANNVAFTPVLCPFALEQCCINEAASDLRVLCGHDACFDSDSSLLLWGLKPAGAFVVRDPCDLEPWEKQGADCIHCPEVKTTDHTAKYKAYVKAADGQILNYPTVEYTLQARNSSDADWQDIYKLPDGISNVEQSLDTLIKSWETNKRWQKIGGDIFALPDLADVPNPHVWRDTYFGFSVSLAADKLGNKWVAIGAPGTRMANFALLPPIVRLFKFVDGDWEQAGPNIIGIKGRKFGFSISLVIPDGDMDPVIAIGSPLSNTDGGVEEDESVPHYGGGTYREGLVKVYQLSADEETWVQLGSDILGDTVTAYLGASVSLSYDQSRFHLAVGEPGPGTEAVENGHSPTPGKAQVFQFRYGDDQWSPMGGEITGDTPGDLCGSCVSLDNGGNTVAVSYPGHDNSRGKVKQYMVTSSLIPHQRGATLYGEEEGAMARRDIMSTALQSPDNISNNGWNIVIGEPSLYLRDIFDPPPKAKAKAYSWNTTSWQDGQWKKLWDREDDPYFGGAVSISDATVVTGDGPLVWYKASFAAGYTQDSGVRIFEIPSTPIGTITEPRSNRGGFGFSVSLSRGLQQYDLDGTIVAIGSPGYDLLINQGGQSRIGGVGRVQVFELLATTFECHPFISRYGLPPSTCEEYTDVPIGNSCSRRVFTREFRIKAETEGLSAIHSNVFKLYKYIYQIDPWSGKWVKERDFADGGNVNDTNQDEVFLDDAYLYRTTSDTITNINMSNLSTWPAGNNLVVDNSLYGSSHPNNVNGGKAYRGIITQTAHYRETKTRMAEMIHLGHGTDVKKYSINQKPCQGHVLLVPRAWKPGNSSNKWESDCFEKLDFNDVCSKVPDGPITISSNHRSTASFKATAEGVNKPFTAVATIGFGRIAAGLHHGHETAKETVLEAIPGFYTLDPVHQIAINPSQKCGFGPNSAGKATDCYFTEEREITKIIFSKEKRHVIALAVTVDNVYADYAQGFQIHELKIKDENLRDERLPCNDTCFWWDIQRDPKNGYRGPFYGIWKREELLQFHKMELTKTMFSEDGHTLVAIYNRYAKNAYGWDAESHDPDGSSHPNNTTYIVTLKSDADGGGDQRNPGGYFRVVGKQVLLPHGKQDLQPHLFTNGAALSCDGETLIMERHLSGEEVDAQPSPPISRMEANGKIHLIQKLSWNGTQWDNSRRLWLGDPEQTTGGTWNGETAGVKWNNPAPARDLGTLSFLYRTLTANWDCSKFSMIANETPPNSSTFDNEWHIQKGELWTFSYDGNQIKPMHNEPSLGFGEGNSYWEYPDYQREQQEIEPACRLTNLIADQPQSTPTVLRNRDFRGDISMSLDGKSLYLYTRGRDSIRRGGGGWTDQHDERTPTYRYDRGARDVISEDYFVRHFLWKPK